MSRRYLIAHDMDDTGDRWFVVDKQQALASGGSWEAADARRAEIEKREGEGR